MNKKDYEYAVSAAGRVNLIGEHVDYCGGKVMPAALSLKNTVYIRPNGTDKINIKWSTTPDEVTLDINCLDKYFDLKYGNYQAACASEWINAGHKVAGCDMYQDCKIPFGGGLASSAAIEVSTIVALATIAGEKYDPVEVALVAQKAEHKLGVHCGIMDQYVSACGRADSTLLLDCNSLECEYLPMKLGKYSLIVTNCNKPHNLIESEYNERRAETETALKKLQSVLDVKCLAEITPAQYKNYCRILTPKLRKRAAHVVSECERVRVAALALKAGNMEMLGRFLNLSHQSLKDDYEVTSKELDVLVETAQNHYACIGSRITGGGFGGCTVSLVKTSGVEDFKEYVTERYFKETDYKAEFYDCDISDGITVEKI